MFLKTSLVVTLDFPGYRVLTLYRRRSGHFFKNSPLQRSRILESKVQGCIILYILFTENFFGAISSNMSNFVIQIILKHVKYESYGVCFTINSTRQCLDQYKKDRLASLVGITEREIGVGKLGLQGNSTGFDRKNIIFFLFCVTKEKRKIS